MLENIEIRRRGQEISEITNYMASIKKQREGQRIYNNAEAVKSIIYTAYQVGARKIDIDVTDAVAHQLALGLSYKNVTFGFKFKRSRKGSTALTVEW